MTRPTTGSCFCEKVQYRITSSILTAVNCHRNSCQKAGGSVFTSLAVVKKKHFEITSGEPYPGTYKLGDRVTKHFCRCCGTPIFNSNERYPGRCMVTFGSLDEPKLVVPTVNIHWKTGSPG